jgi:hypothetical protein
MTRPIFRWLSIVTATALVAPATALGQSLPPPLPNDVTACAFDAMPHDPDPHGLNVRSAPNASSRILGTLPNVESPEPGVGTISAEFHVVGTQGGWFLIEGAHYGYGYRNAQPYAGRGWVSGKLITTGLRELYLKSAPRADARNVVKLAYETKDFAAGPDSFMPTTILTCSGKWFEVQMPLKQDDRELKPLMPSGAPAGYVRGWTDSYCTEQLTTCV